MRATWGVWYWPSWFAFTLLTLLGPEVYALFTNVYNTQSYWVWGQLEIQPVPTGPWTAAHFIVFGLWLVMMTWLTGHYFFRVWT